MSIFYGLVIYQTQDGDVSMNVLVENDTVWLTATIQHDKVHVEYST